MAVGNGKGYIGNDFLVVCSNLQKAYIIYLG